MDKRQIFFTGMITVIMLVLICDLFILPITNRKSMFEDMKSVLETNLVQVFEPSRIDELINNPKKLEKEFNDRFESLKQNKMEIEAKINRLRENNKRLKEKYTIEGFDLNTFDRSLNEMISRNQLSISLGMPRKGPDEIKEFLLDDDRSSLKRAVIYYNIVEYRVRNIDFMEFGRFLNILQEEREELIINRLSVISNHVQNGTVDVVLGFMIITDMKGKTKTKEVDLIR